MKTISPRRTMGAVLAAMLLIATAPSSHASKPSGPKPIVQIAILLDTSGSMDGLIEQAKGQLWKVVNEFIGARQNGQSPEVQVALFEYGKNTLPAPEGYLRMIQPLTTDLDKISEELFSLRTNGGNEYCGWVIREAVNQLAWSGSSDVYRAIFIAGNEPFTQGSVDYAEACKAAIARGIIVNTIHCGSPEIGIRTKWQDGALLADGKYMTIDQNQAVAHLEAPQDTEIVRLSSQLNGTYLAFGALGIESVSRQRAQDANAQALAPQGAAVGRALAKASTFYRNSSWDLVDAVKENAIKIEEIEHEQLPEELKPLSPAARRELLEKKSQERLELQARIQKLNQERNAYLAERRKNALDSNTLDAAMVTAIREQATRRNFRFE